MRRVKARSVSYLPVAGRVGMSTRVPIPMRGMAIQATAMRRDASMPPLIISLTDLEPRRTEGQKGADQASMLAIMKLSRRTRGKAPMKVRRAPWLRV